MNSAQQIMHEREAALICTVPVSKKGSEDMIIWGLSGSDQFAVKSVYYLIANTKRNMIGKQTNIKVYIGWEKIWETKVPTLWQSFYGKQWLICYQQRETYLRGMFTEDDMCPIYVDCKRNQVAIHFGVVNIPLIFLRWEDY